MNKTAVSASRRLANVKYEIRGELAHRARELEARGQSIFRLNIGNPGVYGFEVPAALREAVARQVPASEAYCQEQGLAEARAAIVAQQLARGARNASVERTFIGNGVSELIDLAMRGLLDEGDEVLVPSPDYPLWTASVILNGGRAVHYPCRAQDGFLPDPDAVEALITPRTRALVVINPNNPTGAVYPRELLARLAAIAARHRLVLMSDEIYDGILYDDATLRTDRRARAGHRVPVLRRPVEGASRLRLARGLDEPVGRGRACRRLPAWHGAAGRACACAATCRGNGRSCRR